MSRAIGDKEIGDCNYTQRPSSSLTYATHIHVYYIMRHICNTYMCALSLLHLVYVIKMSAY